MTTYVWLQCRVLDRAIVKLQTRFVFSKQKTKSKTDYITVTSSIIIALHFDLCSARILFLLRERERSEGEVKHEERNRLKEPNAEKITSVAEGRSK